MPDLEFIHPSPWLNLTIYPDEVDYPRVDAPGPTWRNLQASVRRTGGSWSVPDALADRPGRLVYLSLGSLGSADVALMQRLVDILGQSEHRVIVSKGPLADEIRLPANAWGAGLLPQPAILPQVDLVITHGGNNTTTEALWFGKPMIVLPLFWDQYANAQRIDETGFGVRLETYELTPEELLGAVDRLLADQLLRARLGTLRRRLQAAPGTVLAADLIERVAATGEPVA